MKIEYFFVKPNSVKSSHKRPIAGKYIVRVPSSPRHMMLFPASYLKWTQKDKNPIFSTSFGSVTFTRAKYIGFLSHFPFPKTLFPSWSGVNGVPHPHMYIPTLWEQGNVTRLSGSALELIQVASITSEKSMYE